MGKRGPKRRINHARVVKFAVANPDVFYHEIAVKFHISAAYVREILRNAGVKRQQGEHHKKGTLKRRPGMTDEQFEWETKLHKAGLGLDRGMWLGSVRIFYGYDPLLESQRDESTTRTPTV